MSVRKKQKLSLERPLMGAGHWYSAQILSSWTKSLQIWNLKTLIRWTYNLKLRKTVHVYLSSYKGEREREKKREKERNGGRGKNLSISYLVYLYLLDFFQIVSLWKFNSLFFNVEKPLSGVKKSGTLKYAQPLKWAFLHSLKVIWEVTESPLSPLASCSLFCYNQFI